MTDQKIKLHLATSQKFLPENAFTPLHMMMQIIQPKVNLEGERLPLNICFILDRSG